MARALGEHTGTPGCGPPDREGQLSGDGLWPATPAPWENDKETKKDKRQKRKGKERTEKEKSKKEKEKERQETHKTNENGENNQRNPQNPRAPSPQQNAVSPDQTSGRICAQVPALGSEV